MDKQGKSSPRVSSEKPISHNEKLFTILILLAGINILFVQQVFLYHFIAFVCYLGAAIVTFWLSSEEPESRKWYLGLSVFFVFCCLSTIVFMLVGIKAIENVLNFLATFQ